MNNTREQALVSKHYSASIRIPLTDAHRRNGVLTLILDPYRIFKTYKIGNAAIEHVIKKGLRWTSKGHEPRKIITEMMATLQRELDMMDEVDFVPTASIKDVANWQDEEEQPKQKSATVKRAPATYAEKTPVKTVNSPNDIVIELNKKEKQPLTIPNAQTNPNKEGK